MGRKYSIILLFLVFLTVLLRTAWIGDDAYITMRSVDNWVNGYGLTWNPAERVQTFTHPLWMLLLAGAYFVVGNAYFSLIGLSLLVSLAVMLAFLIWGAQNEFDLALGGLLLILSNAFIDYSTSGLENPISHLLALLFVLYFLKSNGAMNARKIFLLGLLAGLAVLNRMDSILLYLPALLYIFWQDRTPKNVGRLLMGFIPFTLWSLFSLFYYGFVFPNTYYAKLNTSIPHGTLVQQGVLYFFNSILLDPITLFIIASSLLAAFLWGDSRQKLIGAGMILYLGYVVYIGGDLMSGRFFSICFLLAVVLLLRHSDALGWRRKFLLGLVALFLGLMSPSLAFNPPVHLDLEIANRSGISDEQGFYYGGSGLLRWGRYHKLPEHEWVSEGINLRKQGPQVYVGKGIGYLGFYAGPQVHVIDYFALSDTLLARLPLQQGIKWDIGHIRRAIPDGYLETLETGTNKIADPNLAVYYEKFSMVTRGNLWSWERIQAIFDLNIGKYDALLDAYLREVNQ
ncbi:MAG TPA: hypothetical protein DCG54_07215 [Anaerolineae bacterium]|nr:hypothetical protein [Anaerolineae bacterium]